MYDMWLAYQPASFNSMPSFATFYEQTESILSFWTCPLFKVIFSDGLGHVFEGTNHKEKIIFAKKTMMLGASCSKAVYS